MNDSKALIDIDQRDIVETLKQTVAKGLTDAEFTLFAQIVKSTGLNPFKKEIWAIKASGSLQIMTGINGFYAIANAHQAFDGIETETVEDDNGKLLKVVAKVYRKDRSRPVVSEAYFAEFAKSYGVWKTMPRVMLSKCAESMALRKSFPQEMNGLYTQEEMPNQFKAPDAPEIGEQLAKASKPTWAYCVSNIDPDKAEAVKAHIKKNESSIVEQIGDVYVFSKNISKFKNYRITKDEVAEARLEFEQSDHVDEFGGLETIELD